MTGIHMNYCPYKLRIFNCNSNKHSFGVSFHIRFITASYVSKFALLRANRIARRRPKRLLQMAFLRWRGAVLASDDPDTALAAAAARARIKHRSRTLARASVLNSMIEGSKHLG